MQLPKFKDKNLLKKVFTHRSYLNETSEKIESNERLEFLGDSILSYIVASYIFNNYPKLKEGELTSLRAALINTETLFRVAKKLELGRFLLLSRGEEAGRGRENRTILANTLEALIGGLYLDQGLPQVEKFIKETILDHIEEITRAEGLKDSKSLLQEILQEKYKLAPSYNIIEEEGQAHAKIYTVGVSIDNKLLGKGRGKSKQEAEKNAAKSALESLKQLS